MFIDYRKSGHEDCRSRRCRPLQADHFGDGTCVRNDDTFAVGQSRRRKRTGVRGRFGRRTSSDIVRRSARAVRVRHWLFGGVAQLLRQVRQSPSGRLHVVSRIVSVRPGRAHVHRRRQTHVGRKFFLSIRIVYVFHCMCRLYYYYVTIIRSAGFAKIC